MIVALTGTPGTGKTSICNFIRNSPEFNNRYRIIDLNELVFSYRLHAGKDDKRDSYAVDIGKLEKKVKQETGLISDVDLIIEGHLSHFLSADIVIVVRTEPREIMKRLGKRNYSPDKIRENADAEAVDVILVESVEYNKNVFEVDTTDLGTEDAARCIISIIESFKSGKIPEKFLPGKINWIEQVYYHDSL